jgi:DNA gyrase subunit A
MIKMPVDGIRRMGRSTQGVIVMRLRDGEQVSSLAPVVEASDDETDDLAGLAPPALDAPIPDEGTDEVTDEVTDEGDEPDPDA